MRHNSSISNYHRIVIITYLLGVPLLYILVPETFQYHVTLTKQILVPFFLTILVFCIYVAKKRNETEITRTPLTATTLLRVVTYSAVFAVPEEILFRGIIQTALATQYSPALAILFASFIFGGAHILNGSRGFRPSGWNWKLAVLSFFGGLPLGLLFYSTESLLLPTLLHMFFLISFQLFLRDKKTVMVG